jgi:hypothetical protein
MTRGGFFLMTLQTLILRHPGQLPIARIMDAAGALPEEALGTESPAKAAQQFFEWQLAVEKITSKGRKPEWMVAWDESQQDRCVVRLNPGAENTEWWMYSERALYALTEESPELPFPKELADLVLGRARAIDVTKEGARRFRAWVQRVPGYEQEPFIFDGLEDG